MTTPRKALNACLTGGKTAEARGFLIRSPNPPALVTVFMICDLSQSGISYTLINPTQTAAFALHPGKGGRLRRIFGPRVTTVSNPFA